jgi:hypothetical protein
MRDDDRAALEEVQRHLGCGQIYYLDFGRYRGYEECGWMPHAKFRVGRISDLHGRVVPFFRRHPLFGRKADAFDLFAELVALLHGRLHRSPEGLLSARKIAEQLQAHNRRGAHPPTQS